MYTPGTIANSQRMPTKINKNGAIDKVRILVEEVICQFYFLSYVDNILVACICIQINFLIFTCVSKCFFKIFVAKGDTGQFFEK